MARLGDRRCAISHGREPIRAVSKRRTTDFGVWNPPLYGWNSKPESDRRPWMLSAARRIRGEQTKQGAESRSNDRKGLGQMTRYGCSARPSALLFSNY